MADLTLRLDKGSPLTNLEIDTNFSNLDADIQTRLLASEYTAADVLNKLKTVDGTGSGLDADLLDGKTTSSDNVVNTVVIRDGSGNFSANTITAALLSGDILLQAGKTISFEGSINDEFETTLSVVNPTADRTLLLPNISGTLITSADTGTVTNTMLAGNIANNKLSNSSITIDGVAVSLGGSISLLNANNNWTGIQSFPDDKFLLKDNNDTSKVVSFQVSNLSPGASRSMIIPDETGVIATQAYVTSGDLNLNNQIAALTTAKGYISFQPNTGGVYVAKNLYVSRNGVGSYTITLDPSIRNGSANYAPLVGAVDDGNEWGDTSYTPGYMSIQTISTQNIGSDNFLVRSIRRYNSSYVQGGGNDANWISTFAAYSVDPNRITVVVF